MTDHPAATRPPAAEPPATERPGQVTLDVTDGVAVITVDHPQRRNAMSRRLSAGLVDAVAGAVAAGAGAVVVTGAPPAFSAGGDLAELREADEPALREIYAGFAAVANCPLPTIAAVNGPAVGAGLNLALACDVRLAGPGARFDARFLQLGIHPGGGYTWMSQRALGPQGAAAMTLFGEALDATEAERVGLVWRRYGSDEELAAAARRLAARAASAPREVLVTTKASLRLASGLAGAADALEIEVRAQAASIRAEAFQQRVAALLAPPPA